MDSLTQDKQESESFLSEMLFHFLGSGDDDRLLDIFDSIVRRGLLLTVGNKEGRLDRFPVSLVDGSVEILEVMQHARVCFTDIPERHLSAHCEEYGTFGIGFSRKTILSWGGNPVIYLPNHPAANTLEYSMGTMLYCLHRVPLLMAALRACMAPANASLTINQKVMVAAERDAYIDQAEFSLRRMWSFVKEMSGRENDYRYLYEREWRIVDGGITNGIDSTRELTDDEIRELAKKCERWTRPLKISPSIAAMYPHEHAVQFFRFFDGISGRTVSQSIEVILVPNGNLKARVLGYLEKYPDRFSTPKPVVKILGHTATTDKRE